MIRFLLTVFVLCFSIWSNASTTMNGTSPWRKLHIPPGPADGDRFNFEWQASSGSPDVALMENCKYKDCGGKKHFKIVSLETGHIAELALDFKGTGSYRFEDIPACGCFLLQEEFGDSKTPMGLLIAEAYIVDYKTATVVTKFESFPDHVLSEQIGLKVSLVYDPESNRLIRVREHQKYNHDFYYIQVYDRNQNRNLPSIKLTSSSSAIDDWTPVSHEISAGSLTFGSESVVYGPGLYGPWAAVFDFKTLKVKSPESEYAYLTKASDGERVYDPQCFRGNICARLVATSLPIGDDENVYLEIFRNGKKISRTQAPNSIKDVRLSHPEGIRRIDNHLSIELSLFPPTGSGSSFGKVWQNKIDSVTGQLSSRKWYLKDSGTDLFFDSHFLCVGDKCTTIPSGIEVEAHQIYFFSDSLLNIRSIDNSGQTTSTWRNLKSGKLIGSCVDCTPTQSNQLIIRSSGQKIAYFWDNGDNLNFLRLE